MILLIFGIYAMIAAKFQISRNYGLMGKGARVAGGICIAFALGFFAIFGIPIMALSQALGFGEGGAMVLGFVFQLVALCVILFVLVRIYGNAFDKTLMPPTPPPPKGQLRWYHILVSILIPYVGLVWGIINLATKRRKSGLVMTLISGIWLAIMVTIIVASSHAK
jgi:hypothetical protein